MKKQIIIGSIVLLIVVGIGVGAFIFTNNSKDKKVEKESQVNLTKDVQLEKFKVDKISFNEKKGKHTMVFNLTNTTEATVTTDLIYVVFKDEKKQIIEVLRGYIGPEIEAKGTKSIEALASKDLSGSKTKSVEFMFQAP